MHQADGSDDCAPGHLAGCPGGAGAAGPAAAAQVP